MKSANPLSTKGDLLRYLDECACEYGKTANSSLINNAHMHEFRTYPLNQKAIDAVLIGFVNWVGLHQGLDYGMYSRDLNKDIDKSE